MRWKKIFILAVLLLFLSAQAVPLMAKDRLGDGLPTIAVPSHEDGGGDDGGGEEHPWQDDDGDDGGTTGLTKTINWLVGLFSGNHGDAKKEAKKDIDRRKTRKPYGNYAPVDKGEQK
jgi:hypothetical protein